MEVTIHANTLIKLAELLTALGVIGGVILWCIKEALIKTSKSQAQTDEGNKNDQ